MASCKAQQPETSLYVQPLEEEGSHDAEFYVVHEQQPE